MFCYIFFNCRRWKTQYMNNLVQLTTAKLLTQRSSQTVTVRLMNLKPRIDARLVKCTNKQSVKLLEAFVDNENSESVLIVDNILWVRCKQCSKFSHLSCLKIKYTLSDLLEIVEQFYVCENCVKKGHSGH